MVDGGESKRQAGQDALRLDVGEGVNGPVPLRPSHSLLLFRPNWLFFFFPWNHLSSPSLLRLSIFSRTPNEFYTREYMHIWGTVSIKGGGGRRKNWMNRRRIWRSGGCGVLGPSVWVCAVAGAPCAHMYVWECLPAGHPVGDTEVCVCFVLFFQW